MAPLSDVTIRPVRDDDNLDEVNAGCAAWVSEAFIRGAFNATPDAPLGMWIAEADGQVMGYAHALGLRVGDGHRGFGFVFVRPQSRQHGAGGLLWQKVLSVCTPDRVTGILASIDADDLATKEIALGHGLGLGQLHILSELDLTTFAAPSSTSRDREDGVVIRPLSHETDEDGWRAFADLFTRLSLDTPDHESGSEPMPYEVIRSALVEPWQVMCAWDGDSIIGFTSLFVQDSVKRVLATMLTGVDRLYRGRGLSTAMKAMHAAAVRDAGWRTIATLNIETNLPIRASNRTLGFRRVAALQDVVYDHPSA
jgi:GNAT superfamily N-acetyltransferase